MIDPDPSARCARCGHEFALHFDGHAEGAGPCGYFGTPDIYNPNEIACDCPDFVPPPRSEPPACIEIGGADLNEEGAVSDSSPPAPSEKAEPGRETPVVSGAVEGSPPASKSVRADPDPKECEAWESEELMDLVEWGNVSLDVHNEKYLLERLRPINALLASKDAENERLRAAHLKERVLRLRIERWVSWFSDSRRGHFSGSNVAIRLENALTAVISMEEARRALERSEP